MESSVHATRVVVEPPPPSAPAFSPALESLRAEYRRRQSIARGEETRLDGRSALLGNGRVLLLLVAVFVAWRSWGAQPWTFHAIAAALFVVTLVLQTRVDASRERHTRRIRWYEQALARLDGKWVERPSTGAGLAGPDHPYALDLDVVGRSSLFQLLDTTHTAQGEATLAKWLLEAASPMELAERRGTLQALAMDLDARETIALAGFTPDLARIDERPLLAWGEGAPLLRLTTLESVLATVLPFVTVTLIVLLLNGIAPLPPKLSIYLLAALLVVHVGLIVRTRGAIARLASFAERTEKDLVRALPLLEAASEVPGHTPKLAQLREALAGAVAETGALRRRVTVFQSRGNLIVAVLSPFVLWDVQAARLLQGWQQRAGRQLRGWFEAIGEIEALCATGTYAAEHPDDAWPEIVDGPIAFEAEQLGHPLLPADRCVRNDVALGGPGTALLVTGSNMSGKSTLLRAVGLNTVIALAGLPVRASRMRVSVVRVATVMRVADSLSDGASFFMAEVRRLKQVVDRAHAGPVLFLLDEILQGTNTRERSLGARGVVAHLLQKGASGLVSTHDLSLVQLGEKLGTRLKYAHFTDQVDGDRMTFDYRMRPGVVQTSNALRVMKAVGLDVEIPSDPGPLAH